MSSHDTPQTDAPPLVSFDPEGKAPIVSYNIPEPTSYAGRSYIELNVDDDWFTEEASEGTTFQEWLREHLLDLGRPRLMEEATEEAPEEAAAETVELTDDTAEEDEPQAELAVEEEGKQSQSIPDSMIAETDESDEDDEIETTAQQATQEEQAAVEPAVVTEEEMELSELIQALEEMFLAGDSGPIVGASDRRVTESVAAVGNATKLVSESASGDGSQFLQEADDPAQASLLSSVQDAVEPSLFATDPLSQAGSQVAQMATKMLQETAEKNDMAVGDLRELQPATLARKMQTGQLPIVRYTMGERPTVEFVRAAQDIEPRLVLVERYRLSTFLGNYGAGRTIKTFSLLPGEQTTISVETFRKTEETRKEASSVLDSYTRETAEEFEETVKSEQSNTEEHKESFAYHAEAKAEANWGWGSASASGEVEGGTNSVREEITKNLSTATSKHASEASTKREVEVDTEYEVSEETGKEKSIERKLENTNLSRTLNFVFKQMNQEFVTLTHLVDVRIAFVNGSVDVRPGGESLDGLHYREASLAELDDLLADVIEEDHRDDVREMIEAELSTIFDYRGNVRSLIERVELPGSAGDEGTYLRVDPDLTTTYTDETGNEFTVPGIALSADKNVMRTDGIVVEALLGRGEALDDYASELQTEEVRKRLLKNQEREAAIERERIAREIVTEGDDDAADRFERVFRHLDSVGEDEVETQPKRPIGPSPGQGDR